MNARGIAIILAAACLVFSVPGREAFSATLTWDYNSSGGTANGSGTWNLTGDNWWNGSGDVVWNNSAGNTAQFGASSGNSTPYTVTLSGATSVGGLTFQDEAYTVSGQTLNLIGSSPTITMNASSGSISSAITSASPVTFAGAGALTLLGNNSFSGSRAVELGTLNVNGTENSPGSLITYGNSVVNINGTETLTGNSQLIVEFNQSSPLIGTSTVNVSGALNLAGSTTSLIGQEFGTGILNILNGGVVNVTNAEFRVANTSTNAPIGILTMSPGSLLTLDASPGARFLLANNGSGTGGEQGILNLNGGTIQTGHAVLGGGGTAILNFNGGILMPTISSTAFLNMGINSASRVNVRNGGATFNTDGNSDTIISPLLHSNIAGDGAADGGLTLDDTAALPGTLTLTASNTYTGPTNIVAGTLALAATASIAQSPTIALGGSATLNVTAQGASYHLLAGQTLTGTGNFSVAGTMTVNGGATVLPGGPGAVGTLSVGALTLDGGSVLDYDFGSSHDLIHVTSSGGLNIAGGGINLYQANGTTPLSTPGTYTLMNYSGSVSGSPGNLSVLDPAGGEIYSFAASGGALTVSISGVPFSWTGGGNPVFNWSNSANWSTLQPPASGQAIAFSGSVGLSNTNDIANLNVGGMLFNSAAGAFNLSGNSIQLSGAVTNSTTAAQTISLNIGLVGNQTLNAAAGNMVVNGSISDGGAGLGLNITGASTVVLAGVNSYSGATTISGGTLQLANANAVSNSTVAVNVNNGLAFGVNSTSIGGLTGNGNVALNNGVNPVNLSVGSNGASTTYSGVLSGAGSLTVAGTGQLTLSGPNTYSGGTLIAGGTLALSGAGNNNNSNIAISNGENLIFVAANSQSFSRAITGAAGNVTFNVAGDTSGSGDNDSSNFALSNSGAFTGNVVVNTGLVAPSADSAFGNAANVIQLSASSGSSSGLVATSNLTLPATRSVQLTNVGGNGIFRAYGGETFEIDGNISGPGNFVKTDLGTVILGGSNTYTGTTTISDGVLQFGNGTPGFDGSIASTGGIINNGLLIFDPAVSQSYGGSIGGSSTSTVNGTGTLTLYGNSTYSGTMDVNSGTLNVNGTHTLSGPLYTFSNAVVNINGTETISGVSQLIVEFYQNGSSHGTSTLNVSGTLNLAGSQDNLVGQESGTGIMNILSGGVVNVTNSDFRIGNTSSFSPTGILNMSPGSQLNMDGLAAFIIANGESSTGAVGTFNLNGGTVTTARAITGGNGTATLNLNGGVLVATASSSAFISLGSNANSLANVRNGGVIIDSNGYNLTVPQPLLHSNIAGDSAIDGGLTLDDMAAVPGSLTLAAVNTYTGPTNVLAGTLAVGNPSALQFSTLDIGGSGIVSFGSLTAGTLGGLAGPGAISLSNSASASVALTVGNNGSNTTYSGTLKGPGNLTKIGGGTLLFTGSDSYAGPTTVNGGKLVVNGSLASPVIVNSGGTLGGTGNLTGVTVNSGGQIAPGDAPGILTLSGNLLLLSGAKMDYELDTPSDSDEVFMPSGVLTLDGQQFSDFNFMPLDGFGPGTYDLIDAESISGSGLGSNRSGAIDGLPASIAVQNNELVLTVVPEPGTMTLVLAGVLGIFGVQCRRLSTLGHDRRRGAKR